MEWQLLAGRMVVRDGWLLFFSVILVLHFLLEGMDRRLR